MSIVPTSNTVRPRTNWQGLLIGGIALMVTSCEPQRLGPHDGLDLPPADLERIQVGDEAPNWTLEALSGERITLSQFRKKQDVVLVFYRGHW